MDKIPESHMDLLGDGVKAFAVLATILGSGSPQATPIWFNYDGEYILINSVVGRVKDLAMRKNPHVALAILDPEEPYRYLQVRGIVMEITEEGAVAHIEQLSQKYRGKPYYVPGQQPQRRVIYRIKPEHVFAKDA